MLLVLGGHLSNGFGEVKFAKVKKIVYPASTLFSSQSMKTKTILCCSASSEVKAMIVACCPSVCSRRSACPRQLDLARPSFRSYGRSFNRARRLTMSGSCARACERAGCPDGWRGGAARSGHPYRRGAPRSTRPLGPDLSAGSLQLQLVELEHGLGRWDP